jgi:hypothetical protein
MTIVALLASATGVGAWLAGPNGLLAASAGPTWVQDTSANIHWSGGWATVRSTSASGGTVHQTKTDGSSVTFNYTGSYLRIVAPIGRGRGVMKVKLDGKTTLVHTHDSTNHASQVVFGSAGKAGDNHTLTITAEGTTVLPTIGIDAFVVSQPTDGAAPTPTKTPTPTPTPTSTATPSPTPTSTPEPGNSAGPTPEPSTWATPVPTPTPSFAPTPAPTPTPDPTQTPTPTLSPSTGIYGPAIGMDGIGNTQVGGPDGSPTRQVGYRFRATTSSTLKSIQFASKGTGSGYVGGTLGSMSITVQTDSGGYPSGTVLASVGFVPQGVEDWPVINFSTPASLTAGQLYHIVFKSTDSNPAVNFSSVNNLYQGTADEPRQPEFSDTDWGLEVRETPSSSWWTRPDYTPSLGLYYANGVAAGVGYAYIGSSATISGSSEVRETFTISGADRTISSVGIRLNSVSGSDPLTVRLQSSSGATIATATMSAGSLDAGEWSTASFGGSQTLNSGSTYELQFSTASSSRYSLESIYQGSSYGGWNPATYFSDGRAQTVSGGIWANWGGRSDEDIQFYLK